MQIVLQSYASRVWMIFFVLVSFFMMSFFAFPYVAHAQGSGDYGIAETAEKAGLPNTDQDVIGLIGTLIGVVLGLVGVIFFALMAYGGFLWMTSRGSPEQAGKAKTLIVQSVVGSVIIIAAWAITNFVIGALQGV